MVGLFAFLLLTQRGGRRRVIAEAGAPASAKVL
jgi:hypothetical protein